MMTPAERAAAIAAQARAKERLLLDRDRNRALMPETAKHLDQFTATFGKLPAGRVLEGNEVREWGDRWWQK